VHSLPLREPPGILGRIAARTRSDVAIRAAARPASTLEAASPGAARPFAAALRDTGLSLIAELKPRAPSGGALRDRETVESYVEAVGPQAAALSVLCDAPFFDGGLDLLVRARARFAGPVLCKDFIVTEYQLLEARAAGADAVLLIVALLPPSTLALLRARADDLGMATLVEVHDADELREAIDGGAPVIGVNSRDLRTLALDLDGAAELLATIPADRVRVAESGLRTRADVARVRGVCDAVLIGTALSRAEDPGAVMRELGLLQGPA